MSVGATVDFDLVFTNSGDTTLTSIPATDTFVFGELAYVSATPSADTTGPGFVALERHHRRGLAGARRLDHGHRDVPRAQRGDPHDRHRHGPRRCGHRHQRGSGDRRHCLGRRRHRRAQPDHRQDDGARSSRARRVGRGDGDHPEHRHRPGVRHDVVRRAAKRTHERGHDHRAHHRDPQRDPAHRRRHRLHRGLLGHAHRDHRLRDTHQPSRHRANRLHDGAAGRDSGRAHTHQRRHDRRVQLAAGHRSQRADLRTRERLRQRGHARARTRTQQGRHRRPAAAVGPGGSVPASS